MDWARLFPDKDLRTLDVIEDLMDLDIGFVFLEIVKNDPSRESFGYIPLLASSSEGELGAV